MVIKRPCGKIEDTLKCGISLSNAAWVNLIASRRSRAIAKLKDRACPLAPSQLPRSTYLLADSRIPNIFYRPTAGNPCI